MNQGGNDPLEPVVEEEEEERVGEDGTEEEGEDLLENMERCLGRRLLVKGMLLKCIALTAACLLFHVAGTIGLTPS